MSGALEPRIHGLTANQGSNNTLQVSGVGKAPPTAAAIAHLKSCDPDQMCVCVPAEEGEGASEGAGEGGAGKGSALQQWPPLHIPHRLLDHTVLLLQPKHHGEGGTQLSR